MANQAVAGPHWFWLRMLGQNNPIAGFVHILPSAGLYLTQHFLLKEKKLFKALGTSNCLFTHVLQINFYVQQKKETHSGLKQLESE